MNDTETTRQCFEELVRRYRKHRLGMTAPQSVYSEAGLGKAYLKQMGVLPWREVQRDFDPATLGAIMSSYFGGVLRFTSAAPSFRRSIAILPRCTRPYAP